ncbi:uncharacterized protein LOC106476084 isoform X2 [Limulus polyphemus]|nr:uncharacterized protein LOC106476084 isoform X2 [Limulus polyphemus]
MCDTKKLRKPTLPHGWVEYPSKSHPDRIYYFNMYTGMSSWTCPQLKADADSSHPTSNKDKERKQAECVQRAPGQSPLTIRKRPHVTPASPTSPSNTTASVSPFRRSVKRGSDALVSSSSDYQRKLPFTTKKHESPNRDSKIKLSRSSPKKLNFPLERTDNTKTSRKRAFEPTVTSSQRYKTECEKKDSKNSLVKYPERKIIKLVKKSNTSLKKTRSPSKSCSLSTGPSTSMTRKGENWFYCLILPNVHK